MNQGNNMYKIWQWYMRQPRFVSAAIVIPWGATYDQYRRQMLKHKRSVLPRKVFNRMLQEFKGVVVPKPFLT